MKHLITVFSDLITVVSTKKGVLWWRWSLAHLRSVQWKKKEVADTIYNKGNTRKLLRKKLDIEVATHYNSKAVETPPLEIFKTQVDNAFNRWFCSWSWPQLEQAVVTETSKDPFQPWVFYDKCQNAPISLDIAPLHRYHLQVAADLTWKTFCLVSYHINGNAAYSMLSRLKKQKIQDLALLQALYVLGQTLYPCCIISEQLQLGTKHIMTPLNTSDCCAFSPFLPQPRMFSLNWCITRCQHLPVSAYSQVKIERLLRVALSSKICITSPNFQEMTGLLWKSTDVGKLLKRWLLPANHLWKKGM